MLCIYLKDTLIRWNVFFEIGQTVQTSLPLPKIIQYRLSETSKTRTILYHRGGNFQCDSITLFFDHITCLCNMRVWATSPCQQKPCGSRTRFGGIFSVSALYGWNDEQRPRRTDTTGGTGKHRAKCRLALTGNWFSLNAGSRRTPRPDYFSFYFILNLLLYSFLTILTSFFYLYIYACLFSVQCSSIIYFDLISIIFVFNSVLFVSSRALVSYGVCCFGFYFFFFWCCNSFAIKSAHGDCD